MDRFRIAMLSTHSCPVGPLGAKDTGGMSVYIREVARELAGMGHTIDIYTRIHDPEDRQIYSLGRGARLIHLKAGKVGDLDKMDIYNYLPEFAGNLEEFRRRESVSYDLIFSHYWLSGCVGEVMQGWWHVPHMIMFHTLGAVKASFGQMEPELRIRSERRLVRECQRVIAATVKEKDILVGSYGTSPGAVRVIPCGVNLELFRPLEKRRARARLGLNGDKIILFVGRLEPLKGIDRLLRAVSSLRGEETCRLVIIGGDTRSQGEMNRLKALSARLRIQDLVDFPGRVNQERLPLYYSAADVTIVPSYYESFGLVALESLASGTPVVSNDVGDIQNIIQPGVTGYVVEGGSISGLAEKIGRLLSGKSSVSKSADEIRASVIGYRWSLVAQKINRECQELAAEYSNQESVVS
jgi:D-inositol-3-phosphate glycosyltransferase